MNFVFGPTGQKDVRIKCVAMNSASAKIPKNTNFDKIRNVNRKTSNMTNIASRMVNVVFGLAKPMSQVFLPSDRITSQ